MESVPCNLCGVLDAVSLMVGRDQQFDGGVPFCVVRCGCCGLVYLNPRPDAKELEAYYPLEYQTGIRDWPQDQGRVMKLGFDMWLKRRTPPSVPGGRVLDIGCADGTYLVALRNLGWKVHGLEISPESAEQAREQSGLDVRTGAAETALAGFPDDYFDVVTLWHVLEHLLDPSGVLGQVYRILKPGGRLMLEVPNFRSPSRFILRTYWFPLDLPRHLYQFTPQTLEAMLNKKKFRVTGLQGVPAALAFTMSLQLLWNRWTGNLRARGITLNPVLLCFFFPVSWLLARLRLSAHMAAEATKPVQEGLQ